MDVQELKQRAIESGEWVADGNHWAFPDGSSIGKNVLDWDQHHGHLAIAAGLIEGPLDPYDGDYEEYWQVVNSLTKNFRMARVCGGGSYFQVWDRSCFKAIVKYLEKNSLTDMRFKVDLVKEGKCFEVESLEEVNYEISRALRSSGDKPTDSTFQVGLHPGIEATFADA